MTSPPLGAFRSHDSVPWQLCSGYDQPGATEKILFRQSSGAYARLVRWPAGFVTGREPLNHPDVDEFAWVLSGRSVSLASGVDGRPGDFCFIDAGLDHGPFRAAEEVVLLEFRLPAVGSSGRQAGQ